MRDFDAIPGLAAMRHGGEEAVSARSLPPLCAHDPRARPDGRRVPTVTTSVFQAGLNRKAIEAKRDGFEAAFQGFDPIFRAFMDDRGFDALAEDDRIARNGTKIASVRDTASTILSFSDRCGVGAVPGGWPSVDDIGLLELPKPRGSRLGGTTAQYALRFSGRVRFIPAQDVIAKPARSKTALRKVQEAFHTWMDRSGRFPSDIGRVLAMSI